MYIRDGTSVIVDSPDGTNLCECVCIFIFLMGPP
jgi:hypothetical protein